MNGQLGYGVALPPEKVPWCQVEMRVGGLRARLDVVKNRNLCPCGGAISEPIRPADNIVIVANEPMSCPELCSTVPSNQQNMIEVMRKYM
jgi:hypothetical protein